MDTNWIDNLKVGDKFLVFSPGRTPSIRETTVLKHKKSAHRIHTSDSVFETRTGLRLGSGKPASKMIPWDSHYDEAIKVREALELEVARKRRDLNDALANLSLWNVENFLPLPHMSTADLGELLQARLAGAL